MALAAPVNRVVLGGPAAPVNRVVPQGRVGQASQAGTNRAAGF